MKVKNKMQFKNLSFNKKFEIIGLDTLNLDYIDRDKQRNKINIYKKRCILPTRILF